MAWFRRRKDGDEDRPKKVVIAEGLWVKCDSCREIVYRAEVDRAGRVCPKCGYPCRISARERNVLMDGFIIAATVPAVLMRKGSY